MIKKSIILSLVALIVCFISIVPAGHTVNNVSLSGESPAKVIVSASFGQAPLDVSFDASAFLYHFGNKLSFSWDFNDGSMSDGVTTTHTFMSTGTYTVALTVTTPFGPKDAWVVIIVK